MVLRYQPCLGTELLQPQNRSCPFSPCKVSFLINHRIYHIKDTQGTSAMSTQQVEVVVEQTLGGQGADTRLKTVGLLLYLHTARRKEQTHSFLLFRNTVPHSCGICLFFQTIWNSFPYLCISDESVSNSYSIATALRQQPRNFISRFVGNQHRCKKSTFQYLWSAAFL